MKRRDRPRPKLFLPERLDGVVGRAPAGQAAFRPAIAIDVWKGVVGARIAERAEPVDIERGTLLVRVATSAWASELSLLAGPIVARLQAAGAPVSALRCRVGALESPSRQPVLRVTRAVPPPVTLPGELEQTLSAVDDEALRASIEQAARANLAWQAHAQGKAPTSGGSRAARVPRSAETGSDRPARTKEAAAEGARRKP